MSKAYYYCKNFSFREVNNLFCYGVKDPIGLTTHQKLIRLYRATLRKIMAMYFFSCDRMQSYDKMLAECRKVREDFDKMRITENAKHVEVMQEKYEFYVEKFFEPYVAMHESRPHSNLHGKALLYGDRALNSDPHGYYQPRLITATPSDVHFHEEYPLQANAWIYTDYYRDPTFDYSDPQVDYQKGKTDKTPEQLKEILDRSHEDIQKI